MLRLNDGSRAGKQMVNFWLMQGGALTPGLPMRVGRAGTMTRDYKRHGVTTLFTVLDVLEGKIFGRCMKRYRYQEPHPVPQRHRCQYRGRRHYAAHSYPKVIERVEKHPCS